MARFDILGLQYFTDGGELLGGGKLNFYETGTTTRKTTYSNAAMTIANTNPVTLDADGRAPNIFFAGLAKCVLTDSTGVILETRDPVGDDSVAGNGFPAWAADVTYSFNQPVTASDGYIYTSLVNNNIGNNPVSSPTEWQLLAKTIGFPDTPDGAVYVVDTAQPLKINAVPKNTVRAFVPILSTVAANVATVDFTGIDSTYPEYEVHIINAIPATDSVNFYLRTSANGGATYDAAASDYRYGAVVAQYTAGSVTAGGNLTAAFIMLNGASNVGSDANETGASLVIRILNPSAAAYSDFNWQGSFVTDAVGALATVQGTGSRSAAAAINAIRFLFSSGNIESGRFTLYGIRTS